MMAFIEQEANEKAEEIDAKVILSHLAGKSGKGTVQNINTFVCS